MAADRTGRVWEEVRRALGRLAGHVSSHSLTEAQAGIGVVVRHPAATVFAEPATPQADWRPLARVRGLPAPADPAGGGGIDLASVATVVGADRALGADDATAVPAASQFKTPLVHAWMMGRDMPSAPSVHGGPVRFGQKLAQSPSVTFDAPSVQALSVVRSALPKPRSDGFTPWKFVPPRTRAGLTSALRVPMTCHRLAVPPGAMGFAAERRLLATTAGVAEADVALIGVFPHVPLGAVLKLAVVPDWTALQIWVRPDVAGRGTPTVTVVLGRQRSTGKMLQVVRRGVDKERG